MSLLLDNGALLNPTGCDKHGHMCAASTPLVSASHWSLRLMDMMSPLGSNIGSTLDGTLSSTVP